MEQLYTVKEIASLLKLSEKTIRRRVEKGTIPYIPIGGNIRFDKNQVQRWLDKRTIMPKQ